MIAPFLETITRSKAHKFSSAGREDADVLMLGKGRPFYMELLNPRHILLPLLHSAANNESALTTKEYEIGEKEKVNNPLQEVQARMNKAFAGKVGVRDLQCVGKSDVDILTESASTKNKTYEVIVVIEKIPGNDTDNTGSSTDNESSDCVGVSLEILDRVNNLSWID